MKCLFVGVLLGFIGLQSAVYIKNAEAEQGVKLKQTTGVGAGGLPRFFTYLKAVDQSILQEMRYFGSHNFLGRPVRGYLAGECILTMRAARALGRVQKRLLKRDLSLKVYDCYRPQRAVNDFIAWARDRSDTKTKAEFYPTLDKSRLFGLGYIARRSMHSRGSTVDLTIVPLPAKTQPKFDVAGQVACFLSHSKRYADNSLDFGTGYDCFHEKSHTKAAVGKVASRNRALLVSEMALAGFDNYRKEWWHFSLRDEPYRKRHFDFPITAFKGETVKVDGVKPLGDKLEKRKEKAEVSKPALKGDRVDKLSSSLKGKTVGEEEDKAMELNETALRVVCVASDDVLNVREQAMPGSKIVTAIPFDGIEVMSSGCAGAVSLQEWHEMDAIGRRTTKVPWCRISSYKLEGGGEKIEAVGWVSGAFVAGDGYEARRCKQG